MDRLQITPIFVGIFIVCYAIAGVCFWKSHDYLNDKSREHNRNAYEQSLHFLKSGLPGVLLIFLGMILLLLPFAYLLRTQSGHTTTHIQRHKSSV